MYSFAILVTHTLQALEDRGTTTRALKVLIKECKIKLVKLNPLTPLLIYLKESEMETTGVFSTMNFWKLLSNVFVEEHH